jgi:hypothetical protein
LIHGNYLNNSSIIINIIVKGRQSIYDDDEYNELPESTGYNYFSIMPEPSTTEDPDDLPYVIDKFNISDIKEDKNQTNFVKIDRGLLRVDSIPLIQKEPKSESNVDLPDEKEDSSLSTETPKFKIFWNKLNLPGK